MAILPSIFRTKGKLEAGIEQKVGQLRKVSSVSSPNSSTPAVARRVRGLGLKLPVRTASKTEPTQQTVFCLPSCPIEEDMHRTGLYLHEGRMSDSLSFLFGANNPPPDVKAAHSRLMTGGASDEDEDLILLFLAHHPFQAGNVTEDIYFGKETPELLIIEGNPLSFINPEVPAKTFVPIRVAPIKAADESNTSCFRRWETHGTGSEFFRPSIGSRTSSSIIHKFPTIITTCKS
ncbi:MAG: hypothetical protein Q9186_004233 [Xanthomendoza sp. 1 TL-2023]